MTYTCRQGGAMTLTYDEHHYDKAFIRNLFMDEVIQDAIIESIARDYGDLPDDVQLRMSMESPTDEDKWLLDETKEYIRKKDVLGPLFGSLLYDRCAQSDGVFKSVSYTEPVVLDKKKDSQSINNERSSRLEHAAPEFFGGKP